MSPLARAARSAMPAREFAALAAEVTAACGRYGVPAWTEHDQDQITAALWRGIHPDLAGTAADPYVNLEDPR